jgi:hypothetical protein
MEITKLFTELQRRQDEEQTKAHEAILKHDDRGESMAYSRRSAFSEFEMWLDLAYNNNPNLQESEILQELEHRMTHFSQEAEKFYSWKTETTGDEFRWQGEAVLDLKNWLQSKTPRI